MKKCPTYYERKNSKDNNSLKKKSKYLSCNIVRDEWYKNQIKFRGKGLEKQLEVRKQIEEALQALDIDIERLGETSINELLSILETQTKVPVISSSGWEVIETINEFIKLIKIDADPNLIQSKIAEIKSKYRYYMDWD